MKTAPLYIGLLSLQDFLGLLQLGKLFFLFGEVFAHTGDFLFLLADLLKAERQSKAKPAPAAEIDKLIARQPRSAIA